MATPIVTGLPRWPWRYLFLSVLDREDNGDIGLHLYSIAAFGGDNFNEKAIDHANFIYRE